MRGAPATPAGAEESEGIIPADAGSTSFAGETASSLRDHPRGCGEHMSPPEWSLHGLGSSPRMRGARGHAVGQDAYRRIIPADAGSTGDTDNNPGGNKDHPRGCGEHQGGKRLDCFNTGSSPRMRGAPTFWLEAAPARGIIPADAGSTAASLMDCSSSVDHPRGCGEHMVSSPSMLSMMGSSPRMRGALRRAVDAMAAFGIIPADAGSTFSKSFICLSSKDHPRGCGEHGGQLVKTWLPDGSSPRMRGAHE